MTRVGLIGCGMWDRNLARNLAQLSVLAGVADRVQENADDFASQFAVNALPIESLLEDYEVKGIVIATSAPSHVDLAIRVLNSGKHVYVEKPLTRTFQESEMLIRAAKKFNVATQMGNQGHCQDNYYQFKSWVENGIINQVKEITTHMNGRRRWHGWDTKMKKFPIGGKIPKTLDWDIWHVAYPHNDFHKDFIDGQWRCWYAFGNGALGDWGAHIMDGFHQFLDLGLPQKIEPKNLYLFLGFLFWFIDKYII